MREFTEVILLNTPYKIDSFLLEANHTEKIYIFYYIKAIFDIYFTLHNTHNINANQVTKFSTAMHNILKPYTLARFEPTIVCSGDGDDDLYNMPPCKL
jgi:hypothetical protein